MPSSPDFVFDDTHGLAVFQLDIPRIRLGGSLKAEGFGDGQGEAIFTLRLGLGPLPSGLFRKLHWRRLFEPLQSPAQLDDFNRQQAIDGLGDFSCQTRTQTSHDARF
jgi:hypothetical protein